MHEKSALRDQYLAQRRALKHDFVATESEALRQNLALFLREITFSSLIAYVSMDNEPEILPLCDELVKNGHQIGLFRIENVELEPHPYQHVDALEIGPYGIKQPQTADAPLPVDENTVILTPGVVFDEKGGRIGYGKGYFDKFISKHTLTTIGIAYDFQVLPSVPTESHDRPMNAIVTPSTTYTIS